MEVLERGVARSRSATAFLSHVGADLDLARTIARDLAIVGVDVWLDRWELELGADIDARIELAISEAKFFVVLLNDRGAEGSWLRDELDMALQIEERRGTSFVIPVIGDQDSLPLRIRGRLYVDLASGYWTAIVRLACHIAGVATKRVDDGLASGPILDCRSALECIEALTKASLWSYIDPEDFEELLLHGARPAGDGRVVLGAQALEAIEQARARGHRFSPALEHLFDRLYAR